MAVADAGYFTLEYSLVGPRVCRYRSPGLLITFSEEFVTEVNL